MTALHDLGATELVALYRRRELSPVEATEAVLARIAAWEPQLGRPMRSIPRRRSRRHAPPRHAG